MEAKKLMAGLIVGMMIMSGLAIVNVVTGSSEPEPTPKATVQRITLMEDFTNWGCGPCAGYNPYLIQAVEDLGYSKVAPVFYHWYFPAANDPMDDYMEAEQDPTEVEVYYSRQNGDNNYVPNTYSDGIDTPEDWNYAACLAKLNARLAVPSNMIITTEGALNESALTGIINIHVEITETITNPSDMRLYAQLWENNITRALNGDAPPYPNGETEMKWACWDMILSEDGYDVSSLNTIGETLDLPVNFNFESEWIADEIGVTVFVAHNTANSISVEQAAAQLFDNTAPSISLVNPNPNLDEQVLSGIIPVTWSVTDEDPATIDITLDYSPNQGATWFNIMGGTNNNIPPYTYNWDSTTVSDGIDYILRVTAEDELAKSSQDVSVLPFSIDNIQNNEWFFQVDTTAALKDLNMRPVEQNINLALTSAIPVAGDYQVGAWQTTQTFASNNINGAWTFRAYGKVPHPGVVPLQGYLYAKVFSSSNMATPLATTSLDNENVGTFQTSHLFTWTSTLAGSISSGDSLVVEIWLSAVGGPYIGAYGSTVNPGFDTGAAPWTYHAWSEAATGAYNAAGGNPGGYVNITLPKPGGSPGTQHTIAGYWEQSFATGFAPTQASLSFDYICTKATTASTLYIFVDTTTGNPTIGTQVWSVSIPSVTSWIHIGPLDISSHVTADTTYYMKIALYHAAGQPAQYPCAAGYDNMLLTYANPYSWFEMEYDFTSSKSSVQPTIGTVTNPPYAINCVGKPANSWVYVSFPIAISGNIQTILNDATLGDGGTTWTAAKWCNPQTPMDPWKTYRVGSTVNDLTTINNAMGVWLWITANGGDQMLTTGLTGAYPAGAVNINLYTGWNMVGYPSATSRAETATLTNAAIDFVAVWQAATPYITQHAKGAAMMAAGNAYWVHCTADCTWAVNP